LKSGTKSISGAFRISKSTRVYPPPHKRSTDPAEDVTKGCTRKHNPLNPTAGQKVSRSANSHTFPPKKKAALIFKGKKLQTR